MTAQPGPVQLPPADPGHRWPPDRWSGLLPPGVGPFPPGQGGDGDGAADAGAADRVAEAEADGAADRDGAADALAPAEVDGATDADAAGEALAGTDADASGEADGLAVRKPPCPPNRPYRRITEKTATLAITK